MSWTPSDALLFQHSELTTDLAYHCFYQLSELQTVSRYSWSISPEQPEQLQINHDTGGVYVTSASLVGLFEPVFIQYLDGEQVITVADWSELPPGKPLIEFRPTRENIREYILTVTVVYIEIDELTAIEKEITQTQTWRCVIYRDYSAGRLKLLEYINVSGY